MARTKQAPPPPDPDRETIDSFETAILENPDDDAAYLVYADWLMAKSDPRGELIVLQHDADEAERPRKNTLGRAARMHLEKHAAQFLGPLHDAKNVTHKVVWRYGFLRSLELEWTNRTRPDPEDAFATLAAVLRHPSARFLVDLNIGCIYDSYWEPDLQGVIDTLASLRRPEALRTLDIGITSATHVTTAFGEFNELVAALPALRRIRLRERRYQAPSPDDPVHEMTIKRRRSVRKPAEPVK